MYLKSLELTGFKSFAKKTALDFTSPITAIVGPNGSGKSNIAEAFRFVLGEQSIKSMRGKRTEDLIWNGSPELGRLNRASVKLTFDNRPQHTLTPSQSPSLKEGEGRLLNLDFDEAILERVIYRDSGSEYLLNGSQVRLRDIVELLSGAHIGASGHHIISQGEADRILNASLKERREMIEDALGLKIYQWKRAESERKLQKTEENMKQVEGLRKELAPHLSFLKKQLEKIERVEALKAELRALYAEYLAREHAYLAFSRRDIDEKERAPKKELVELEGQMIAAKKLLEAAKGRDAKTSAVIALQERMGRFRKEREALSRDIGRLEGEIGAGERLMKKASGVETALAVPLVEVEEIARLAEEAFSGVREDTGAWFRQALEKVRDALSALLGRHRSKTAASGEFRADIASLFAKKKELEQKLSDIDAAEREALVEEKGLRADIEKEKDSSRDAEKEMFRIMARQNELRGTQNALEIRRHELEHLEGDFKRELTEGALLAGREILEYEKGEVKNEAGQALNLPEIAHEDRAKQETRRRAIERLKIRVEDSGAGGSADIVKEYDEAAKRDEFLARELADLKAGGETLRSLIAELLKTLDEEFQGGILKINEEFQTFFTLMFGGGTAKLTVVKPEKRVRREIDAALLEEDEALAEIAEAEEEETETGIDIEVSLPRKKIKGLMMLSGGERALTSIALIFAMSQVKPPPFIILDETDAALDEANSRKYGDMVENLSKHSQLILITHNRETMSRAGVLYGVTMDRSGVSKLLSIAFEEAAAVAK